uniref:Uncharacterized protein n=1 Tax=Romanomermis culicivorax TaxID=13658 RepID=A0A915HLL0_ROMCU
MLGKEKKYEDSVILFSIARLESPDWEFGQLGIAQMGIARTGITQFGIRSLGNRPWICFIHKVPGNNCIT